MTNRIARIIAVMFFMHFLAEGNIYGQNLQLESGNKVSTIEHVRTNDISIVDSAFSFGYTINIVHENFNNKTYKAIHIQSASNNVYVGNSQERFSLWMRDLYWGFLGWSQAGDDSVLEVMKSSLQLMLVAKNKNQAIGENEVWPLNDGRFYIPQAFDKGIKPSYYAWPWCSESQADFLLMAYNYWQLSGDIDFIESIWNEIKYITETLQLLDTNRNSLPDALQGTYDYSWISMDTEEPLMCAKTSKAYSCVAELARLLNENNYADELDELANEIKETMNKNIEEGGLWKDDELGGYYVYMRRYTSDETPKQNEAMFNNICTPEECCAWRIKNINQIKDNFIPFENLIPIFLGMTSEKQNEAIFKHLDSDFKKYYDLPYGPMYCAPVVHNEKTEVDFSSVTWLAFLDIYLRSKTGHSKNKAKIYELLIKHAYDAGGIPFSEGIGVWGYLTGGAGRSWDNGNFFHMLVCGIYGLEKSKDGILITSPAKIEGVPLTELNNFKWRDAVYNFSWQGDGSNIKKVTVNGKEIKSAEDGLYKLVDRKGNYNVEVFLY
ncbi:MAG: hypothetical protein PVH88_00150 [Ignavibacteria bacterium]|jgi:hypothetical protein